MLRHCLRLCAFSVILVLAATSASAADVDIPFDKFTLDNGLTVIVHEDRKAPVVAVSVWYHVGSKDEPEGKSGFAHLFEHLMFNGSENFDGEYFEPLQEIGATDLNGTTWLDRTNYYQTVPTPAVDLALWLESDRMGHLLGAVTEEKLENQRGVVQNEKRQGENQPYGQVFERIQKGLFPLGHPYHHTTIGSMEDLDSASLEDVHEWFRTHYGPNNAVVVLAGDIDAETARPLVETYFGDIAPGPTLTKVKARIPERDVPTVEVMEDRVPAARVYRVWAVPNRNTETAHLLEVAGRALAQGKSSRLYKDLVYDRQIATSIDADLYGFELASLFFVEAEVKEGVDPEAVLARIDELMAAFRAEGPSAEELERAATGYVASRTRALEKVGGGGGKAVTLAQGELYADDPAFYKKSLRWIENATPEAVKAAVQRWLDDGYYQLTVVPFGEYAAAGEGVDRSALPEVAEIPELKFPEVHRATLSNGIEVVLAERHAVPLVEVAIQFDAGYAADKGAKLGTARLAMAMLDEGTKKRSALEISDEKERLGAELGASSNLDTSTVSLSALKSNLRPSLELMADVVQNPAFANKELERLRQIWFAQISQEEAQPVTLALRKLPPLIYGSDHPYGIPFTGSGTKESVESIARDDLLSFHRSWIRPDNAKIFVVGDTTMDEIRPLLERSFGKWRAPNAAKGEKSLSTVALPQGGKVVILDRPDSQQSIILAGSVAPPSGVENNPAIEMMNDTLGGQFTARINMNLREDKGWAYGAYTFLPSARGQRPFIVYAPVQTDKTADSLKELMKELDEYMGARPVTEEERNKVVNNNVRSLPGQFETAGAVMSAFLTNNRLGRPLDYHAELPVLYGGLATSDLAAAAEEVVHPDQLIWVIVGDKAKIEEDIRALSIAPVEIAALK